MLPLFFSSVCPVFACSWIGFPEAFTENESYVIYSGGGGSTKSGVLNKLVLAKFSNSPPSLQEVCSIDTETSICTSLGVDSSRPGKVFIFIWKSK
jgi:hypothetical protein